MPNGDAIRGIEIIEGNNNVLLIAPHAFNGDRSRGLKADDENTGALTQEIASSLASYAIINKFYKRSRKENSNSQNSKEIPEPEKDRINLYRYDQSKDHITAYLQLIDNIVTKIVRAYGHAIVLWIHGLGDDSLEDIRMSDGYNDVNVLIGIGRRNDGETAYAETANKLIDALESNKEFRTIAKLATAQTGYQGAHENVLNQYFLKQKGYDLSEVESMQLEIQKPGFRDRASIPAAAKAFATAIGHLIPKNVEVVPAQNIKPKSNLVERAFFNLSEIFSRHFEKAMTEAGQYILEEFFGGDIERASLGLTLGVSPLLLMATTALAASMAFMLPVATPPNAVVFGSGYVTIPQMSRVGLWLNLLGIVAIIVLTYLWLPIAFAFTG